MKQALQRNTASIGLAGLGYRLPAQTKLLEQLQSEGRLTSPAALLREFGFDQCHLQSDDEPLSDLLFASAQQALQGKPSRDEPISRIFLYTGVREAASAAEHDALRLFQYPVTELQHRLELPHANAIAISQQGCSGLLSAIDIAYHLLAGSPGPEGESILCAALDYLPPWAGREIMYNLVSDAAGAVLVSKHSEKNRIVHFHQQTQPYYWDTPLRENELLAAYFPLAQRVIRSTLEEAGLNSADIKWFVPHNVSLRSWTILAQLLDIPLAQVWTQNIARVGHTVSCDHIINLVDMERAGVLERGDYLLLFTFGFGASWSCLILQH